MHCQKDIVFSDFANICRFCLDRGHQSQQLNKLNRLFHEDGSPVNDMIIGAIRNCLGFEKISPFDGMPQSYCAKCLKALVACSSFRRLCAVSAQQLQAILRDRIRKDTTTKPTTNTKHGPVVMELEIEELGVNETTTTSATENNVDHIDTIEIPMLDDTDNACDDGYIYYQLDADDIDSDNTLDINTNYEVLSNSEYISDGQTNFDDGNDILDEPIEETPESLNRYLYDGDVLDDDSYYSIEYANNNDDSVNRKEDENTSVDNSDAITIDEIKIEKSDDDDVELTNDKEIVPKITKKKPPPKSTSTKYKTARAAAEAAATATAAATKTPVTNAKRKTKNSSGKKNGEKELCPDCGGFFISLKNHLQTHRDRSQRKCYTCDECDAKFVNKASFVGHVNKHNNLTPFHCPKCPRKFHGKGNLRMHMNSHSTVNRFACTECDKAFRYSHMLALHRRSHTLERVYFCEFCTYCSVNRENYKNHMMNHTGVYRFNCSKCMKGFKKKIYYLRHMKTHDGEPE